MKILSIDVGIKHLAFCLFHSDISNAYKIENWGVMNLCNEKINKCCGLDAKKNPCARIPRYTKKNNYYCKIHAKHQNLKIPPKTYKHSYLKKAKCKELKNIYKALGLEIVCKNKTQLLDSIIYYLDKHYLDPIIIIKASDLHIVTLGRNMRDKFNTLLEKVTIDRVIIENQIGPLANRMKTLQGMVMQHFIELNVPIIEEISASNKLKSFLQPQQKTTYNERKKLGIEVTLTQLNTISEISEWREFFLSHKKKDDLADSFLQGLWYLTSIQ